MATGGLALIGTSLLVSSPAQAQAQVMAQAHGNPPCYARSGHLYCGNKACARPHVTRPVLAYQDIRDSAVKYVDCRARDCAQHVTVTLSGESYAPPVPVIDRAYVSRSPSWNANSAPTPG
ncbi:hypothetical protein GCM10022419_108400 [Nonomuraea rosea]|uniref:Uncharacterized protein n=1 Tax=Nonomuraea rosea TaxID=638574 RepID=A0ABP6ZGZ5_9ACTN